VTCAEIQALWEAICNVLVGFGAFVMVFGFLLLFGKHH
jgi:hypothetical protein